MRRAGINTLRKLADGLGFDLDDLQRLQANDPTVVIADPEPVDVDRREELQFRMTFRRLRLENRRRLYPVATALLAAQPPD